MTLSTSLRPLRLCVKKMFAGNQYERWKMKTEPQKMTVNKIYQNNLWLFSDNLVSYVQRGAFLLATRTIDTFSCSFPAVIHDIKELA